MNTVDVNFADIQAAVSLGIWASQRLSLDFDQYPFPLSQSTVSDFATAKVLGDLRSNHMMRRKHLKVRIILPFKDERSANS